MCFYDESTIRRQKQVIIDNYDFNMKDNQIRS